LTSSTRAEKEIRKKSFYTGETKKRTYIMRKRFTEPKRPDGEKIKKPVTQF